MTTPKEDDAAEDGSSIDNSTGDSSTDPSAGNKPGPEASALGLVTSEEWERLRAPFSRDAYVVHARATGRTEANLPVGSASEEESSHEEESSQSESPNQVVADLRLHVEAIRGRLDLVLGPDRYSYRLETVPDESAERSVFCHLRIGDAIRTGIGTGSSYRSAQKLAIANAVLAFGIGKSGKTAGPIIAGRESRFDVPPSILEALETEDSPSLWSPGEDA